MSLLHIAGGATEDRLYVEDVFSTYLYNGNDSTQTINNGIDLAGKGGLVWFKRRDTGGASHCLFDTTRGTKSILYSNTTSASFNMTSTSQYDLTSFNNNGFTLGAMYDAQLNVSGYPYASWTFRKAPKFFDVVTYTGNGTAYRSITHSLGIKPGLIIIKRTDTAYEWAVWHRGNTGVGATAYSGLSLNTTSAATYAGNIDNTPFTVSAFDTGYISGNGGVNPNTNGATYVAYLFAHDPSTEGIIQCGSFTTDASGNATVTLGWEPQWMLLKRSSDVSDWAIHDSMRGWTVGSPTGDRTLYANSSVAENAQIADYWSPSATGFTTTGAMGSGTYIYLAIRRPMKVPTRGTEVYGVRTVSGAQTASSNIGLVPDAIFSKRRTGSTLSFVTDRLRGLPTSNMAVPTLRMESTAAESSLANDYRWGVPLGGAPQWMNDLQWDTTADGGVGYAFRRAPGFFDVVCYTGTGSGPTVAHGLTVEPELIILKSRSASTPWQVYCKYADAVAPKNYSFDLSTSSKNHIGLDWLQPSISSFRPAPGGTYFDMASVQYVAYLFATLANVSKCFSYTGNGTSLNVECGFSTGARFVLCKRTDSTGDWFVFDSVRGITASNDPHLSLNTTAAEVTTDDSIDPYANGFTVNQNATTNLNVNGGTYIGLAIA